MKKYIPDHYFEITVDRRILNDLEKELKETTGLMNKYMKECIDKDHKIAVLERALRNCCEHLVNTTDIITKPFSEDYADESRIKEKFQIYINQAEKELEEENK